MKVSILHFCLLYTRRDLRRYLEDFIIVCIHQCKYIEGLVFVYISLAMIEFEKIAVNGSPNDSVEINHAFISYLIFFLPQ